MPGQAFLVRDNWGDYSFKTTFQLLCVDPGGEIREIGGVKIGRFGMTAPARTPLPDDFETLDGSFFSLRLQDTYYERLRELGPELQRTVLGALNDVSFDLEFFSRARTESVTGTSLLSGPFPSTPSSAVSGAATYPQGRRRPSPTSPGGAGSTPCAARGLAGRAAWTRSPSSAGCTTWTV
ncbi:hypothetical protein [Streptomyces sp. NPDC046197]|uniref:hypothetical protein n=1 Tax=Streptomyces sp. NPDC046197 TaxID=3154337 RepID=UPI0033E825EC